MMVIPNHLDLLSDGPCLDFSGVNSKRQKYILVHDLITSRRGNVFVVSVCVCLSVQAITFE